MATLISSTVAQTGSWPQIMTIVQEFDHPVVVTEDFKLVFYTKNTKLPLVQAQMTVAPVQFVPSQLSYTVQVSPFADGQLGVLQQIGGIQDIYGNPVDLKIGNDFDVYNTNLIPYLSSPRLDPSGWLPGTIVPPGAICPGTTAPKVGVRVGPWSNSMEIPENMWNGGNFYLWCNYTWKPDQEAQGIPFVWEPPFFYSLSQFGIPLNQTITPYFPPFDPPAPSILNNIISSGTQTGWDTCGGWVQRYPKWKGKVQVWAFGDDDFGTGIAPFPNFPASVGPDGSGDLSPEAIFGFPLDAQLQFYKEFQFAYNVPSP